MHRDLYINQSFNKLYCTEIFYALEREENHDIYVPYWFYCSKTPKGAQVMITIIQSEKNIWDRKWQKGEKIEQKAHREKDTVAPQPKKLHQEKSSLREILSITCFILQKCCHENTTIKQCCSPCKHAADISTRKTSAVFKCWGKWESGVLLGVLFTQTNKLWDTFQTIHRTG